MSDSNINERSFVFLSFFLSFALFGPPLPSCFGSSTPSSFLRAMVHFDNFTNKMQDAVTACLQATQQQQQPAQLDGIKELATTHVGPYAGSENALAIELGEGRTDWRRGALEVVFRRKALDLVVRIQKTAPIQQSESMHTQC